MVPNDLKMYVDVFIAIGLDMCQFLSRADDDLLTSDRLGICRVPYSADVHRSGDIFFLSHPN